jgi:hypothetical protein
VSEGRRRERRIDSSSSAVMGVVGVSTLEHIVYRDPNGGAN